MKTIKQWYKEFHPKGLGIEERETFELQVKKIQEDAQIQQFECPCCAHKLETNTKGEVFDRFP